MGTNTNDTLQMHEAGIKRAIVVPVGAISSLIGLKQSRPNLPQPGVNVGGSNIVNIVSGYGDSSAWVNDKKQLIGVTNRAFSNEGVAVLACRIEKFEFAGAFQAACSGAHVKPSRAFPMSEFRPKSGGT